MTTEPPDYWTADTVPDLKRTSEQLNLLAKVTEQAAAVDDQLGLFGAQYRNNNNQELSAVINTAWLLARYLDTPEMHGAHFDAAKAYLSGTEIQDQDSDAARMLGEKLAKHFRPLRAQCGMDTPPPSWGSPGPIVPVDGMLPLDAGLANYLEAHLGQTGAEAAGAVRAHARERWSAYVAAAGAPRSAAALFKLWLPGGAAPQAAIAAILLAEVLWLQDVQRAWEERQRLLRVVPVPTLHPVVVRTVLAAPRATKTSQDQSGGTVLENDEWRLSLPPAAAVQVPQTLLTEAPKSVQVCSALAVWLAIKSWERRRAGVDRADYIPLRISRNHTDEEGFGSDVTEDEIDAALDWLSTVRVAGFPLVAGYSREDFQPSPARKGMGGRPVKGRVVQVGAPLAPHGLDSVYREAHAKLPPEFRFYSFLLEHKRAPVVGNKRTFGRQRDFYALGLGAYLTLRREEYAARGGVEIIKADWRAALREMGIYHRSHQSLADDVLDELIRRRVMEPTPAAGVYRLGPEYQEQEKAVLAAADRSQKRRAEAVSGKTRRAKKQAKSKT